MATVTRENIGILNEKIIVKVAKDDYLPSFQKAIKDYSKKANIPGFRKGMVPVGMVKKMYGSSVFAYEVIKSVERGLTDYMKNEQLNIFAQPLPLPDNDAPKLDMNQPDEYQFSFEVGLKPEFSIADLAQAHVTKYKIDVTDKMINEEIDRTLIRGGEKTDAQEVTSEDNELIVTFIETDAEGNEIEGGTRKETSLQVKYFTDDFRNELMGKKIGDFLIIHLSRAFEEKEMKWIISELALVKDEQEAMDKFFKLLIDKVSSIEKPALAVEFFKLIYPGKEINTEEEFRNEMRNEIETQWDSQTRSKLHDQIYHELLHTNIDFPEDFLKRWMLTGTEKQKSPDEVEREFPVFVNQLKWSLITEKLVRDVNIEVTPEELVEFAKAQLLGYMGGSNINIDQPWVADYIARMMKDNKFVEDSYQRIQTNKLFSWAETQVHPAEVTISVDDFTKMLEEHKHVH
ncbi:MAG: trigger factor [Chitinophagaceae bacterium]